MAEDRARPSRAAPGSAPVTRAGRALALRPPSGGAALRLRFASLSSAPAPLARALPARVPSGTRKGKPFVFLTLRYGTHAARFRLSCASSALPARRPCGVAGRDFIASVDVCRAAPAVLLAYAARCQVRGARPPSPNDPSPRCDDPGLRPVIAIAAKAAVRRGAKAPLRSSPGQPDLPTTTPQTRTGGPVRKPPVITVRGHRVLTLYRALTIPLASQCGKYLRGSGGGAPRLLHSKGTDNLDRPRITLGAWREGAPRHRECSATGARSLSTGLRPVLRCAAALRVTATARHASPSWP